MERREAEFLIIGGGPCGIGAAHRLEQAGADWALLEAEDRFGGLSASCLDEHGFTWDIGGHVLFSHYQTFDDFMIRALGDAWFHHERESWIWIKNRFVPYPFQYNLHRLDPADRRRCVEGLVEASARSGSRRDKPAHFAEWMQATMGRGIAELFMRPYNMKVWAVPPEEMSYGWIGERVAVPPVDDVLRSIETGRDNVSWGPNNTFRFPRQGGTGTIWQALGAALPADRCQLNTRVVQVDAEGRKVAVEGGGHWTYKYLISTMPLDRLIGMSGGFLDASCTAPFRHSATHVVGIGMTGSPPDHLVGKCWMYFPQTNSPYYRVTVFSHYSRFNVARPGKQWSLMAEVAGSPFRPVAAGVVDDVLRAFREDGLIRADEEILTRTHLVARHAYPTPFLDRDAVVDPLLRRLEQRGVFSRGRFGAWKYEVGNMDHCFAQGRECAGRLLDHLGQEAEPTLFTPHVVNSRRNP